MPGAMVVAPLARKLPEHAANADDDALRLLDAGACAEPSLRVSVDRW